MRGRLRVLWFPAVVALVAAGCGGGAEEAAPAAPEEQAPVAVSGSAVISGTVHYTDGDPDTPIKMDADPICAGLHPDPVDTETLVADEAGNLANVFVYVKEGLSGQYAAPSEPRVLNQEGCLYHPHVSGIQVGQKLVIRNDDPTLHNVHALPAVNREFNQGQPFQGMELERTFDAPEVMVRFKCDVHPWMSAYMGVVEHPFFAVTGTDGTFSIEGLPAGEYVIEAWHETLGTQTQSVTVGEGGTAEVAFEFAPAAG